MDLNASTQPVEPLILIVDDYLDARELYAELLEFSGYRVVQAGDGAEALAKASELLPSMVLMDLSLPVMDGWEATERIKSDPRTARIPVVALTGHTEAQQALRQDRARCDGVLIKPCMPEDMLAEVRRFVR